MLAAKRGDEPAEAGDQRQNAHVAFDPAPVFVLGDPCGGVIQAAEPDQRLDAIGRQPADRIQEAGGVVAPLRPLEVLQRCRVLAAVERDEPERVIAPRQPGLEHRRERELLAGESQRLGVVELAEQSADRPASQQAVHPHRPFVLLLSALGALGRVLPREQEVPGVGLDVRQQPEHRRPLPLVASLDGVVQHLEAELSRSLVLADPSQDVRQHRDRPIPARRRRSADPALDLDRALERVQPARPAGDEVVEHDAGGCRRECHLVAERLGDRERSAPVFGGQLGLAGADVKLGEAVVDADRERRTLLCLLECGVAVVESSLRVASVGERQFEQDLSLLFAGL